MGSPNATGYNGRVWLHFMESIYTDVYMVYRMYDGEESKMLHIGCPDTL